MPFLGSFCLLFALALAAYCLVAGIAAAWSEDARIRLGESARRAGIATFFAVSGAALALVWAALNNDFSVTYILQHSNRALPIPYKLAALWSGQEGSLLFWSWLLACYGFVLRVRHKVDRRLVANTSTILAAIQIFFLILVNFVAKPFGVSSPVPADGNGLNPLLQYPEMVIHPPMLYLGYVGFSLPFAFALAALMMRYPGEKWIHITRRWTMVTWLFLTCGITLGAHWAYAVLGWGGYWGWDPVENASFFPWLTGTAFLHSVMMQEKRGMMKMWNLWLIFVTFMLCILGTMLTRAGLVSSVHAFAQSSIGPWFVTFLIIIFLVCAIAFVVVFVKDSNFLASENPLQSVVSRESSFLFNNLMLLALTVAIVCGTLWPLLSEAVVGYKVAFRVPYFNIVTIPSGLFLVFLTAVGPLLAWGSTSLASIKRNFVMPTVLSLLVGVWLFAAYMRPWLGAAHMRSRLESLTFWQFCSWMALTLSTLVLATVASEFIRGGRVLRDKLNTNLVSGMYHLSRRNMRRYGGYVAHIGFALVVIGLAGLPFNQEQEQEMSMGDTLNIGHYSLVSQGSTQDDLPNYRSEATMLDVYKDGSFLTHLSPAVFVYKASEQPDHKVAIHHGLFEDLYVIYAGGNPAHPTIKAFVNPLVSFVWLGVFILVLGTGVALVPNAVKATVPTAVTVAAGGERAAWQPAGVRK
ncbi:MAG TPA: cytochrome c-type biogenesis CcmF C-terminal domain-containing protein [Candidatus Angelobacter sp.]|nr:cytochrome c-type biogenesis CcmF C-terminal domain-containing protein [Candidatus Angelobacter sp.]